MRPLITAACVLAMLCTGVAQQPAAPAPATPQTPPAAHAAHPNAAGSKTKAKLRAARKKAAPKTEAAKDAPAVPAATPAPPVAAQAAPPVPATLMNQPPVHPTVTLQNGLLMIDAPNSTLGEVLSGVGQATGAAIDESVAPGERVAVRLGPGDPRQVIAALLEGTPYDYLILGSPENPDAITRIVLTQSASGPEPNAPAAVPQPQAAAQPSEPPPPPPIPPQESGTVTGAVIDGSEPHSPQMPAPQPAQQQPPAANSPEQLFQQLLRPKPNQPSPQ
jgi:hypothetical protein